MSLAVHCATVLSAVLALTAMYPASARAQTLTIELDGPSAGIVAVAPAEVLCPRAGAPVPGAPAPPLQRCVVPFSSGTQVRVSASAPLLSLTPGSLSIAPLTGGSASSCVTGTSTCTFTITQNSTLRFTFNATLATLFRSITVNNVGEGPGEIGVDGGRCVNYDPQQPNGCTSRYMAGSLVTLTPRSIPGGLFLGFSNGTFDAAACGSGTGGTCSPFQLNADSTLDATHAALTTLNVTVPPPETSSSAAVYASQVQQFSAQGTFRNGSETYTGEVARGLGLWKSIPPLPAPRVSLAAAGLNGLLYAVGGAASPNGVPLDTVTRYDPLANQWAPSAPLPTPRSGHGVAVVSGKLYAIGGRTGSTPAVSTVDTYDPASGLWTTTASMNIARRAFGVGVVDGIIYVAGGLDAAGNTLGSVEALDPVAGAWTIVQTTMPTTRHSFAAAVVDGMFYAVGGRDAAGVVQSAVEAYDPATNTWIIKASLPNPREQPGLAVVGSVLYALGGALSAVPQASVAAFDPATNSWSPKAGFPVSLDGAAAESMARADFGAATVDGVLYVIGGRSRRAGDVAIHSVQAFADNLSWTTSDRQVASVTQSGQARALRPGVATIVATAGATACLPGGCGTLTVNELVARDDAYQVRQGATLEVPGPGVLANDTFAAGASPRFFFPPDTVGVDLGGGGFRLTAGPSFAGTIVIPYRLEAGSIVSDTANITITVVDTQRPSITSVTPDRATIPRNRRMNPVQLTVVATDNSGTAPVSRIVAVLNSQADYDDGPSSQGWRITGPLTVDLLGDREGRGRDRRYTIFVTSTDAAGNVAYGWTTVAVEH